MGDFKPSDVNNLKPYIDQNQIFEVAVGRAITHSKDPNVAIAQFPAEINKLVFGATLKESYNTIALP